ncbi:MAG: TolC family protein [Planctomycetota bacterium]|jgi:outer membrane protein TolC
MIRHISAFTIISILIFSICGCSKQSADSLQETRDKNAAVDLEKAKDLAPLPSATITVKEAVNYALENNMQLWLARQVQMIQLEKKSGAMLKMLPSLRASQEVSRRDRHSASSSANLFTGEESLSTSYSSEKKSKTFNLSATWNLLDFGVTYLRSKQEADRVVVSEQDIRRTRQRVAMDVSNAYWQAVTAKKLSEEAEGILTLIEKQLQALKSQVSRKNLSESDAIEAELPLLRQRHRMSVYRRSYETAMQNLAELMGVPVGSRFKLADVKELNIPDVKEISDISHLETLALKHRPELFQDDARERIGQKEARIALIDMFPSPSVFWRYNYDGNKYLHANDWQTVGLTAAWDILSIPSKIKERKSRTKEVELTAIRRLAATVAVLTQIHISVIEYQSSVNQIKDASLIEEKSRRLVAARMKAVKGGKSHGGQVLAVKTQRIQDLERYLQGYLQLISAQARLYNSLGLDPDSDGCIVVPDKSGVKSLVSNIEQQTDIKVVQILEKDQPVIRRSVAAVRAVNTVMNISESSLEKELKKMAEEDSGHEGVVSVLISSSNDSSLPEGCYFTYRADGTVATDSSDKRFSSGSWDNIENGLTITFKGKRSETVSGFTADSRSKKADSF